MIAIASVIGVVAGSIGISTVVAYAGIRMFLAALNGGLNG